MFPSQISSCSSPSQRDSPYVHSDDLITAEQLYKNPQMLTRGAGSAPIRAFDGAVGAILSQGEYFVVSPYDIPLLEPPLGMQRVRMRKHGSFGPHDWIEYPQLYHPDFVHFTCIPYPPGPRSKHKYSCFSSLWLPIERGDFVQVGPGVIGGLGKISFPWFAKFRDYHWQIRSRTVDFLRGHSNVTERALARSLLNNLQRHLTRLEHLVMQFRQMLFTATSFKRLFLELIGLLDYCQVYKNRMEATYQSRQGNNDRRLMGAFVVRIPDAELLFRAGIPFYFVHPVRALSRIRVDEERPYWPLEENSVGWEDHVPACTHIYEGPLDIKAQFLAITHFHANFLGFGNAFSESANHSSDAPRTMSGPIRSHETVQVDIKGGPYAAAKGKHWHQSKKSGAGGRDKYQRPTSSFYPDTNECWQNAIASINRDDGRRFASGYAFPDPALFVSVTKTERMVSYLQTWLFLRNALILRLSYSASPAQILSNQQWRDLLSLPLAKPGTVATTSLARHREQILKALGNAIPAADLWSNIIQNDTFSWQGEVISPDSLQDPSLVKRIIWEVAELNFRSELVGLDAQLREESESHGTREQLIVECFPGQQTVDLSCVNLETADQGLGGATLNSRVPFFLALRDLMLQWKGIYRDTLMPEVTLENWEALSSTKLQEVEKAVATMYVQIFYGFYGRPPIIPHRALVVD